MQILKFDLAGKRISKETSPASGTAVFSDLLTDTLFVLNGTTVLPMHGGAGATGRWKGRLIKAASGSRFGFAWLRVNGDLEDGVTVKLYGEGALLYTTPVLTSIEPVRLPPGLFRAWEVEVQSKDRITSVTLASSVEELV